MGGMFVLGAPDSATVDPNARGISSSTSSIKVFTRAGNFGIDPAGDLIYRPKDLTPDVKNAWNWKAVEATLATLTVGEDNGGSLAFNAQSGALVTATPPRTQVSITPVGDGAPLLFNIEKQK